MEGEKGIIEKEADFEPVGINELKHHSEVLEAQSPIQNRKPLAQGQGTKSGPRK